MNYLDLFSGIGGFALGAYWAGMKFENHYASEIDKYCVKLYQKRFPDSIQLGDITKIETEKLPKGNWIITGGFPCQDISIAGKGAGIRGSRSGLWFEMWRIIRDLRPRFAIMENVGMLVHRGLREVLGSLAEIGYDAEWQDIRASDMGAPHRRERIWIVAYPRLFRQEEYKKQTTGIIEYDKAIPDTASNIEGRDESRIWRRPCGGSEILRGDTGEKISDTTIERLERQKSESKFSGRQPRLPAECDWWSVEPNMGRLAHGIQSRVDRLKGLGNAIVPQIAEMLFRQIGIVIGKC